MKVLVTGGAGFVGANLCKRLQQTPSIDFVRVIDNLSTGFCSNLDPLDVDLLEGDITDQEALGDAMSGVDAVVHLAARPSVPRSVRNPEASHHANATGTLNVLELARDRGVDQVILASSSSVYGANVRAPKQEAMAPRPLSPYAASKLAAESYALAYQATYDLPVLVFRFFNVYGPLQSAGHAYAAVIPTMISAALKGEPLTIYGDGHQTRDFTYVEDVVDVIVDALARGVTDPEPINLAFGSSVEVLEVVGGIERILGKSVEIRFEDPRAGEVKHSQADPARLQAVFPGVSPTQLDDGLTRTIEWFQRSPEQR